MTTTVEQVPVLSASGASLVAGAGDSATTLWLVRHAEVEPKYQRVFGGCIDMDLSARGHQQAIALARYFHRRPMHALYASPMKRVQQTIAPLLGNGGPQPIIRAALREVDFGAWTGLGWEEVQTRFGLSPFTWLEQLECAGIPNAECSQSFRQRVAPCLEEILQAHAGEQIMIACHGGVIRMLLAVLFAWPLPSLGAFEIDYASITRVRWARSQANLQLLNFVPWPEVE